MSARPIRVLVVDDSAVVRKLVTDALKTDPEYAVTLNRRFATEASGYGITSVQLMADPLPIAETVKYLVQADVPIRWKTYRFPMRPAGRDLIDSAPPVHSGAGRFVLEPGCPGRGRARRQNGLRIRRGGEAR